MATSKELTLSEWLKYYRNKLYLSQFEVAQALNVSLSTITKYEGMKSKPRNEMKFKHDFAKTFKVLADEIGVTIDTKGE